MARIGGETLGECCEDRLAILRRKNCVHSSWIFAIDLVSGGTMVDRNSRLVSVGLAGEFVVAVFRGCFVAPAGCPLD